jgi:hypothetical protein
VGDLGGSGTAVVTSTTTGSHCVGSMMYLQQLSNLCLQHVGSGTGACLNGEEGA